MAEGSTPKAKPRWLLLGGCGFVGRNLVKYLLDNELASFIRVVDKKAPFMAFLSADYRAALVEQPRLVECVQADVADADMLEAAFFAPPRDGFGPESLGAADDGGAAGGAGAEGGGAGAGAGAMQWDFVVNLAAETALGKRDDFYQKAVDGAAKSGALAAALAAGGGGAGRLKKYVFVSSASVYEPTAAASREDAPLAPWTAVAESMLRCERALAAVPGLPLVVLRPALVYGPGDFGSLMPRCVVAASYQRAGERMELLWDGSAKLSTVHVFDVARAIVLGARKLPAGSVFNLADKGDSDAGKLTAMLATIFGIEACFSGSLKSNMANLALDKVVDAANENHLGPWLRLLSEHGIKNTPLSPFLHKSLLAHNQLSVDGAAIEAAGFKYAVPAPTLDLVRDPILQHVAQGIFPSIVKG